MLIPGSLGGKQLIVTDCLLWCLCIVFAFDPVTRRLTLTGSAPWLMTILEKYFLHRPISNSKAHFNIEMQENVDVIPHTGSLSTIRSRSCVVCFRLKCYLFRIPFDHTRCCTVIKLAEHNKTFFMSTSTDTRIITVCVLRRRLEGECGATGASLACTQAMVWLHCQTVNNALITQWRRLQDKGRRKTLVEFHVAL